MVCMFDSIITAELNECECKSGFLVNTKLNVVSFVCDLLLMSPFLDDTGVTKSKLMELLGLVSAITL